MEVNFREISIIQEKVDNVVMAKSSREVTLSDLVIAMHVEVFEFINTVGTWKWWKHSHVVNRERVLDELADVMAFYLAYANRAAKTGDFDKNYTEFDEYINDILKKVDGNSSISLIKVISKSLHELDCNQSPVSLMGLCLAIARDTLQIEWEDAVDAYILKSQENIKRQENNY